MGFCRFGHSALVREMVQRGSLHGTGRRKDRVVAEERVQVFASVWDALPADAAAMRLRSALAIAARKASAPEPAPDGPAGDAAKGEAQAG